MANSSPTVPNYPWEQAVTFIAGADESPLPNRDAMVGKTDSSSGDSGSNNGTPGKWISEWTCKFSTLKMPQPPDDYDIYWWGHTGGIPNMRVMFGCKVNGSWFNDPTAAWAGMSKGPENVLTRILWSPGQTTSFSPNSFSYAHNAIVKMNTAVTAQLQSFHQWASSVGTDDSDWQGTAANVFRHTLTDFAQMLQAILDQLVSTTVSDNLQKSADTMVSSTRKLMESYQSWINDVSHWPHQHLAKVFAQVTPNVEIHHHVNAAQKNHPDIIVHSDLASQDPRKQEFWDEVEQRAKDSWLTSLGGLDAAASAFLNDMELSYQTTLKSLNTTFQPPILLAPPGSAADSGLNTIGSDIGNGLNDGLNGLATDLGKGLNDFGDGLNSGLGNLFGGTGGPNLSGLNSEVSGGPGDGGPDLSGLDANLVGGVGGPDLSALDTNLTGGVGSGGADVVTGPDGQPLTGPDGGPLTVPAGSTISQDGEVIGPDGSPVVGPNGKPLTLPKGAQLQSETNEEGTTDGGLTDLAGDVVTGPDGQPLTGSNGGPLTVPAGSTISQDGEVIGPNGSPVVGPNGKPLTVPHGSQLTPNLSRLNTSGINTTGGLGGPSLGDETVTGGVGGGLGNLDANAFKSLTGGIGGGTGGLTGGGVLGGGGGGGLGGLGGDTSVSGGSGLGTGLGGASRMLSGQMGLSEPMKNVLGPEGVNELGVSGSENPSEMAAVENAAEESQVLGRVATVGGNSGTGEQPPFMPPMSGGMGGGGGMGGMGGKKTWVTETEDTWGTGTTASTGVLGR
jgi:hypothetical protein